MHPLAKTKGCISGAYLKIRFRAERRDFYGETGGGGRGISRYFEPEPKRYSQKSRSLRAGMEF
ncbi:MAG: hypothetical protein A3D67_01185 [Candidatus Lloydbacteria bacterium RIFCSPHIGHO2_02_FULL_51_22]|uniref:Uncharacterized protein n=1 Tax=Candidatus Lloydbacteria bacterium RIFCSPHIGHO2_02_FULL_51_22 TaxID=1798663 RepID=A0A1G2DD59_9BACT|nr:MAG: hypothetical protein A3D67_01185 [Candidatus Lloydbacteria bacterium RIFCSPHIGHO2_02_FULL_51_22]